jgi:hypothetical protein
MQIDPVIKFRLQKHLVNAQHPTETTPLKIGTLEKLTAAVRIVPSETVYKCFDSSLNAREFPTLPKRTYLIACVQQLSNIKSVQIYALYTLEQMVQMQSLERTSESTIIRWHVFEISEKLEKQLLVGVDLEEGMVVASMDSWTKKLKSKL